MTVSHFHELEHRCRLHSSIIEDPAVLGLMTSARKFVFMRDVRDFIQDHKDEYTDALAAAVAAGHTELVFDPMVIETDCDPPQHARNFWLLQAKGPHEYRLRLAMFDQRVAIVTKLSYHCRIATSGIPQIISGNAKEACPNHTADEMLDDIEAMALHALFYSQTLHIRGIITRPPPPVPPKLANARAKRGVPPITTDYVTVHIGYVTDRHGVRHDLNGHHIRMHLRRGHQRNQACGADLKDHKLIWIPATLVNYQPGAPVVQPDYKVVP